MIQNLISLIFNFTIKNTAVHVKCNSASGRGRQHASKSSSFKIHLQIKDN